MLLNRNAPLKDRTPPSEGVKSVEFADCDTFFPLLCDRAHDGSAYRMLPAQLAGHCRTNVLYDLYCISPTVCLDQES